MLEKTDIRGRANPLSGVRPCFLDEHEPPTRAIIPRFRQKSGIGANRLARAANKPPEGPFWDGRFAQRASRLSAVIWLTRPAVVAYSAFLNKNRPCWLAFHFLME